MMLPLKFSAETGALEHDGKRFPHSDSSITFGVWQVFFEK